MYSSAELSVNQTKQTGLQWKMEVWTTNATWYNDPLPSLDTEGFFYHSLGLNMQKEHGLMLVKLALWNCHLWMSWEVPAARSTAEIERKALLSLSLCVFVCVSHYSCTVFVKLKKPLSPGNRSCATQMVPSLFAWEAEPLSAVVLPVSCSDLNLGSSLPSSASLSLSTRTHTNSMPSEKSSAFVKS